MISSNSRHFPNVWRDIRVVGNFLNLDRFTDRVSPIEQPLLFALFSSNMPLSLYLVPGDIAVFSVKSTFLPYPMIAPEFFLGSSLE